MLSSDCPRRHWPHHKRMFVSIGDEEHRSNSDLTSLLPKCSMDLVSFTVITFLCLNVLAVPTGIDSLVP